MYFFVQGNPDFVDAPADIHVSLNSCILQNNLSQTRKTGTLSAKSTAV